MVVLQSEVSKGSAGDKAAQMKDKPVILIVDDLPQNIELLEAHLVPQGYEIVKAANGKEALEILSGNQIDLILLDVLMPGMDGFEVTRRVRQDDKNRLLPIILITALRETEDRVKGIEAGCDDFLSKPVDKMEILTRVRSLLKVKAYNDLMKNYRKELESEVTRKTDESKRALENLKQEITERRQAEHALKISEVKYRRLFETAQDGILILNADTGQITDVNPFLTDLLGYPREELLGKELWEIGPFKDIKASRDAFQELQSQGYVRYENLPLEDKSGKRMSVEFVSNVYMVNSQRVIQCNIRDITKRVQSEKAQEKLRLQLQEKVSEMETFSYGIAHDLRSPLVSIEGFSRLLLEDIQNQKVENVREDIRLLESGVRKMRDFLNRTLEYSRAGYLIRQIRDVSFSKIADEIITEFNEQISSIGATLAAAKTFPLVDVDGAMIKQVLTNLIQNSIKYRDKTIPLEIEIGYRPAKCEAVFFVRDNGLGIDASEAEKVFTLFYRGTADGEGSGIGLTIVKKIIEAHGGRIWVEGGQSGKGTTVCFTLPRQLGTQKDNNGKD